MSIMPYEKQCQELTRLWRLAQTDPGIDRIIYDLINNRFVLEYGEWHSEVPGGAYERLEEPTLWSNYHEAKRALLKELASVRKGHPFQKFNGYFRIYDSGYVKAVRI